MQITILKNKNTLMKSTGILLIIAFTTHFLLHTQASTQLVLLIASIIGGIPIFIQAYQALKVKIVSIDLLVSIAILGAILIQNYEESAIVSFLFLFGSYLEQRTLEKTRSAIKDLVALAPETALKKNSDGQFEEVDIDEVDPGDILLVKTGAKIPVDGFVISGSGAVNEASITGEAMPLTKEAQSSVFAGTILENGTLQVEAEKVGEETTFGKIIELVEEAQDSKSDTERFIDRFSKYYTPIVLLLAIIVWLFTQNIELAVTILVLGCPGALVIGVPVSSVSGIGNGARNGILLKGSNVINRFSKVSTILFDKTGTLTIGKPQVTEDIFYGTNRSKIASYLASVERESEHPLAKAVIDYLQSPQFVSVDSTNVRKGGGITAIVDGQSMVIGNRQLLEQENIPLTTPMLNDIERLEEKGNSIVLTAVNGQLQWLMGIRDQVRQSAKEDMAHLKKLGVKRLIVLSGDNERTVQQVADELGLTEAHGQMLPDDKAAFVEQLQKEGETVAFVGDGINDSPSLALADIGIAMGNGTDVAIETSDIVLMNSDLHRLPHALGLSQATRRNMLENIWIAIAVVVILLLSVFFSSWMNMAIGMFVHEGSILVVILNGMRLLRYS